MKKIYIFAAVLALLTLSLNAQLQARKNVVAKSTTTNTEKGDIRPDALFRMGPSRASTVPVTPPYSNGFDSNDEWNWWETIDVDGDGSASYGNGMWALYSNQARYYYHSSDPADDWLITAPVTLKAGKIYKFSFLATTSSSYDERLEVKLASSNTATALSNGTEIIPSTAFRASSGRTFSNENITVSADGNYYFGIHAISDANMYYLYIDNVVIDVEITDPTIQTSASSVTMNSIPGGTVTETVTVTGKYLTDVITTSISGTDAAMFSVSPASLGTSGGELTISYTPTAVGSHTATLTLSSTDADDVTVTLNGTASNDLTICDGNNTNYHLPIYGNYAEELQVNQMIYPEITSLIGKDITSMTFYVDGTLNSKLGDDTWVVKLGTTNQTGYTSRTRLVPDDIQEVYSGYLTTGSNTLTITFDTPFHYNGGNLLVDFEETVTSGDYSSTAFFGVSQSDDTGFYSYNNNASGGLESFLPKVTFTFEESGPKITVSPETQTINDATAGTLTVTGTNIDGNISVSAGNDWSLNPTSLTNNGGDVSVTYTGRDLSASTTVTASATGATDATATVNYVADLYIVTDNGQTGNWDFTTGTHMSYNNGIYTATFTANADNTYILFARLLDSNENWNTRNVFGPDSNGDWWLNGDSGSGNLDLNDDDPIKIVNGGTYTITIDATNGTFTIERVVPALTAPTDVNVGTNQGAGASTTVNISGSNLTQDLTVSVSGTGFSVTPTTLTAADVMAGTTVTVTYNGTDPNATGTLTIGSNEVSVTVNLTASYVAPTPELIAPVDDSTVDVGTNHGNGVSKTINVTGSYLSQDLTVSVSGSGFSISRDITISAADANAGTDITVTYNGTNANATGELTISSSEVSATVHLTASYAEITDITVCDGEYLAEALPVYGYFYDEAEHNQMVYPASMLTDMVGKNITSMTFYPTDGWVDSNSNGQYDSGETTYSGINFFGGSVTFKLMNLSSGTSSFADENPTLITGTMTPVATVTPEQNTSATTWVITFDTPFEYTGGDLLIDVTTTAGTYGHTAFVIDATDSNLGAFYVSYNGTNYRYGADYLPKVTFNFGSMPHVEGGVIHLGHLPIVDQFAKSTAKNEHEVRYGYILVYEPDGEDAKESGKVEVPVEHTGSVIGGFYTAQAVNSDKDRHLKLDILNADVKMTLSDANPNITEYRIQSNEGGLPQEDVFLDKMNHMGNFTYMNWTEDENSPYYNDPVDAGEYHYYDSIPVVDGRTWGSSFKTYLPTVETWGIDRRYYETDHKNNTYGAPIWKTGVGKVDVVALKVEKQQNATTGSTAYASWTDGNGADCNLYMIDGLHADGYLPKSTVSNVEYAPYMFRIFVESPTNMLRGFKWFAASGDNPSHFENDPEFNNYGGPWCIYEENVEGATVVDLDDGGRGVKWYLNKNLSDWEDNARFGALSTLIQGTDNNNLEFDPNNLKVYVRFYYKSTGNPEMVEPSRATRGAGNMFYASEGSKDPQPWTAVTELQYYGEVESVTYYNAQGMQSSRPFDGVNIVVTRYSDGTTRTTKIIR